VDARVTLRDALVANAKQLGLTAAQATKLANAYFKLPPEIRVVVHV
jgi:hypothetical protein